MSPVAFEIDAKSKFDEKSEMSDNNVTDFCPIIFQKLLKKDTEIRALAQCFEKLLGFEMAYFDENSTGALTTRLSSDASKVKGPRQN